MPFQVNESALLPPPITLNEPLSLKRICPICDCVIVPSDESISACRSQTVESTVLRVNVSVTGCVRPWLSTTSIDVTAVSGPVPSWTTWKLGQLFLPELPDASPMKRLISASRLFTATRRRLPSAVSSAVHWAESSTPGLPVVPFRNVSRSPIVVPSLAAP